MMNLNANMLDMVLLAILILGFVIGYMKGFVDRLFSLIGTVAVIYFSYILSRPLSGIVNVSQYFAKSNEAIELFAPYLNRVIMFLLLFMILGIIKIILLGIISKVVEAIKDLFSFIGGLDALLGSVFNFAISGIICYVCILLCGIPAINQNTQVIQQSKVAPIVLKLVPEGYQQLASGLDGVIAYLGSDDFKEIPTVEQFINFVDNLNKMDVVTPEQFDAFYKTNKQKFDNMTEIKVSSEDYDKIMKKIDQLKLSDTLKNAIKQKVVKE